MQQTVLTFYSVTEGQIDYIFSKLGRGPDKDGIVEGSTPLGHVKMRRDWDKGSGQLTVVILEKPELLSVDTIHSHITTALAEAAEAIRLQEIETRDSTVSTPLRQESQEEGSAATPNAAGGKPSKKGAS